MIEKINLKDKAYSNPNLFEYINIGYLNNHSLNIINQENKSLNFHIHEETDEFFYCIQGEFDIEFRDGITHLIEGDITIVPKGISHRPVCKGFSTCLLIERDESITRLDKREEKTDIPINKVETKILHAPSNISLEMTK